MTERRGIHKVITAIEEEAAPGFKIKRPLPVRGLRMIDPFLLLDHMGPVSFAAGEGSGVPEHPHRGFEPVTFLFEGKIEHQDSFGNKIILSAGDVQWMTSGSGIVHSEYVANEFKEKGGKFHGVQLWVNLPAEKKMTTPRYQNIKSESIPVIEKGQTRIRVIAGSFEEEKGPAETHTPVIALHIQLSGKGKIDIPIPETYNAFVYVLEGQGFTDNVDIYPQQLIKYFNHGSTVEITSDQDVNLLFFGWRTY